MLKTIFKILISIFILLTIVTISGFIYFKNNLHYVDKLKPYIESKLSNIYPNTEVKIEKLDLVFRRRNIEIKASNTKLFNTQDQNVILSLNSVFFELDLIRLLTGRLVFSKSEISDIDFNLKYANPDQGIKENSDKEFSKIISKFKWSKIPIDILKLNNLNLKISQNDKENFVRINKAEISLNRAFSSITLSVDAEGNIDHNKENATISSKLDANSKSLDIYTKFNSLPSYIITEFLRDKIAKEKLDLTLNGEANIGINNNGKIEKFDLDIKDSKGLYEEKIVESIDAKVSFIDDKLNIDKFQLSYDQGQIDSFGSIEFDEARIFKNMDLEANIENFAMDNVKFFWPDYFAPSPRKWVVENISGGKVKHSKGKFKFSKDEVVRGALPEGAIKAQIDFEGLNVDYYKKFPKVTNAFGTAVFSEKLLDVNLSKAKIVKSIIESGEIKIGFDLSPISVTGQVEGGVEDIVEFIPPEHIKSASQQNIDLKNLMGKALTDIDISIPITDEGEMKFLIKSKLEDISLSNLLENHNMSNGKFLVNFDGDKADVKGEALLDNHPSNIEWIGDFRKNSQYDSKVLLNTILLPGNINKQFPEEIKFEKGKVNIQTIITSKNNNKKFDINASFDDSEFELLKVGYNKAINKRLVAAISASVKNNENIIVDKINIQGENIDMSGKATLRQFPLKLIDFELSRVKFNDNDFKLSYKIISEKPNLHIIGKSIDLSKLDFKKLIESKDKHEFRSVINAQINLIKLKHDYHIHDLNLAVKCDNYGCADVNIEGYDNKDNPILITSEKIDSKTSSHVIEINNLGRLFKGFDIYDKLKAGQLKIKATKIIDEKNKENYQGKIKLKNFILRETPIFSKLFTFTSLPKIIELPFALLPGESISGNDIPFTSLAMKFHYKNEIMHLAGGTVEGPQLGLTIDGNINFPKKEVNIGGTVIPELLGISKIINNIPLLGTILQGGSHKGLVAANYSIKGQFDNLHTFVNPLSMLTPGFLRNIFSVFESNRNNIEE